MGTTGLETAFAALYTGLVLPGVLELGLLVERMTAGAALFELPTPRDRRGRAGQPHARRPRRRVGRRASTAGRAARRTAASPGGALHGRVLLTLAAGARRLPRARLLGGGAPDEPARARSRGARRRRRPGGLPPVRVVRAVSPTRARSSCRRRASSSVPRLVSEQYPKGLGHTAPEVGLEDEPRDREDASSRPRARRASTSAGRDQAIVCGIETHVCVSQTVHDLLGAGRRGARARPTPSARATSSTTSAASSGWSARARS